MLVTSSIPKMTLLKPLESPSKLSLATPSRLIQATALCCTALRQRKQVRLSDVNPEIHSISLPEMSQTSGWTL
eukprot:s1376_g7.t1